jgi:hypothetical protein
MTPQDIQMVDAAIAAHSQWLSRLRKAIGAGSSEFKPEVVRLDDQCALGRWLYDGFPPSLRGTPVFDQVRQAHARFHEQAAGILALALAGKAKEAEKLMDTKGEFITLSGGLVLKLRALKSG